MAHKGVVVYHCYKDDMVNSGERTYIYTVDKENGGDSHNSFDVRNLPYFKGHGAQFGLELSEIRMAIRDAIDKGIDLLKVR